MHQRFPAPEQAQVGSERQGRFRHTENLHHRFADGVPDRVGVSLACRQQRVVPELREGRGRKASTLAPQWTRDGTVAGSLTSVRSRRWCPLGCLFPGRPLQNRGGCHPIAGVEVPQPRRWVPVKAAPRPTFGMPSSSGSGQAPAPKGWCIQSGWYRTQAAYSMAGGSVPVRGTKLRPRATTRRDPPKCRRP